jgi:phosphate transport system permease protein
VAGEQLTPVQTAPRGDAPVTALHCLYGDVSLLVGTQAGGLEQWFPVRDRQQAPVLTKIRSFPALPAAVTGLAISTRSKAFAAVARDGSVATYFATTGQQRWQGTSGVTDPAGLTMTARGDALLVVGANAVSRVALADPHPEPTLLGVTVPVHYESYDVPVTKWESTPATDAAEPKLSITPLVFGTLKATFFCLLLAVPLAVLAALYVSQFVHPRVRAWVKPTVELMAALPSVVLGFVAAVWLAPLLEHGFPTLLLALLVVPFAIIAVGLAVGAVPERVRQRLPRGLEVIGLGTVIVAAYGLCALLAPWLDAHVFGHDFPGWVRDRLGLDYQQKNAVVVAIAMAFAVIPIVFSIAEDAFSNVPRSLISASLALGANRWQTAAQVVLPTASPGVFSATMIGFGRAIGETMIVLMAVGATAIMDWNPFNGFRSLSANIAIEIGEAEHGGTLYRLLFVTALLLFALTFAVNTLAEIVRARLRKRYATL